MADISTLITKVNEAVRGEEVRDAITAALEAINSNGGTAYTLGGHPASFFAKQTDMDQILPYDEEPRAESNRTVSSGGIYSYIESKIGHTLDVINYGEGNTD